jgi:hypothetical protein
MREGAVGLVGLGHKIVTPAQDGVGPQVIPQGPHHHGGIEAPGPQDRRRHGGGRGLAVGPGDGHLSIALHESGQHLAPAQHGETPGPGRGQLRVVLFYRGGMDHHLGVAQVFSPVSHMDAHPQVRQPPGDGAFGQVRAAHPVSLAHQQLRQAAHPNAANPDEVVGEVTN